MATKKDSKQISLNWKQFSNPLGEQVKKQISTYQVQFINPSVPTQTLLEAYSYFQHLLSMSQEEYSNLGIVYSTRMQVINCLTQLLVWLSYVDREKFYSLASLFFDRCEELFSYFATKEYDELDQGTIGLVRSLYLSMTHEKRVQALKKERRR